MAAHGPGTGITSMPAACAALHEPPTGIADQRCAGIAHERHGLAALELLEEACNALGLVMLVISNKSLIHADSR